MRSNHQKIQPPQSWTVSEREPQNNMRKRIQNTIAWIMIGSFFLMTLIGVGYVGIIEDSNVITGSAIVFSDIDTNGRIRSNTSTNVFEINNPDWKLEQVLQVSTVEETSDTTKTISQNSWSPSSNRLVYFLGNNDKGGIQAKQHRPMIADMTSLDIVKTQEIGDYTSFPNTTLLSWLQHGTGFVLHQDKPRIVSLSPSRQEEQIEDEQQIVNDRDLGYAEEELDSWDISPEGDQIISVTRDGSVEIKNIETSKATFIGQEAIAKDISFQTRKTTFNVPRYINPSWSPDGSKIAFLKRIENEPQFYTDSRIEEVEVISMNSNETDLNAQKALGRGFILKGDKNPLLWSQDGIYLIEPNSGSIFNVEESSVLFQGDRNFKNASFSWSKNNNILQKKLQEYSNASGDRLNLEISVSDFDGSKNVDLFRVTGSRKESTALNTVSVDWIDEGRSIVFSYDNRIWKVDLSGNHLIRYNIPEEDYSKIVVSPDENKILFVSSSRIGVIELKNDQHTQMNDAID